MPPKNNSPIIKKITPVFQPKLDATQMARKVQNDNDNEKDARVRGYQTNTNVYSKADIEKDRQSDFTNREKIEADSVGTRIPEKESVRKTTRFAAEKENYNKASRTAYNKEVDDIYDNEPDLVAMQPKDRDIVVEGKIAQKRKAQLAATARKDNSYSMGGGR